jgi:S1-C subfamily serine protease
LQDRWRYDARMRSLSLTLALVLGIGLPLGCRNSAEGPPTPQPRASDPSAAPAAQPVATGASPIPPQGFRTDDERNTIDIFQRSAPSAVFVTQKQIVVDWWAGKATEVPTGAGTGFIWDAEGHVVTNFHVVLDARSVTVTLQDQKTYPARIVGTEPRKDIAVLQIGAPKEALHPIVLPPVGAKLEVGQKVIAIGNPFGLDHTLTTGIISALGREVDGVGGVTIRDMIQTDAAINPGNSGGPLLDSAGRLIGMNTMIFSKSGAWAGIGFAVPVDTIRRIVPQLVKNGRVEQVGLGIQIDPQQRIERRAGITGVVVLDVVPGSPAEKAGLKGLTQTPAGISLGDVIVGVAGQAIKSYDDLYNTLDGRKAGERVAVKVQRGTQTLDLTLELVVVH